MFKAAQKTFFAYFLVANLLSSILLSTIALAEGSSKQVLLCTSKGLQWIKIDSTDKLPAETNHCIYCLLSEDDDDCLHVDYSFSFTGFDQIGFSVGHSVFEIISFEFKAKPRAPPVFT